MSNRNKDSNYRQLAQFFSFLFEQNTKLLNTAIPGHIVSYDVGTQRARVQIAIDALRTDGSTMQKPPIANVPVLALSGAGGLIHVALERDDPVWVMFSQRGLTRFKRGFRRSEPDKDSLMSVKDAVVWGGFVRKTPAVPDGVCLQSPNGESYISIRDGSIHIKHTGTCVIEGPRDTATFR